MVLRVEYAVGAHARIEELVERLDPEDRECHAAETAPEEPLHRTRPPIAECPRGAQKIGQQPREQEEPVAHQPQRRAAIAAAARRRSTMLRRGDVHR